MEELKRIELDLSTASVGIIEVLIEESDDPMVFEEVMKANTGRVEILRMLYDHLNTPENVRKEVAGVLQLPVKVSAELEEIKKKELKTKEVRVQTLSQKVQNLSVAERIRLAMRGGKDIRSILLKDPNREVVLAVLDNPKLTEPELELIAHSRSVPDEALRVISRNREWMKNYTILLTIVTNPRTPAGISLGFISSLKQKDLKLLEKNKNVAEAVRTAAKRLLSPLRR